MIFNKVWNKSLCELDSDGDGKTNGHELGDPECIWTPKQKPAISTGLSHPGITFFF
jgi:dopamine beta-monooxygenase